MRILKSHPMLKLANGYIIDASQPSNLSYMWNFGSLLAVCLIIQILTGVTLAIYLSNYILMFIPVEYPWDIIDYYYYSASGMFSVANLKNKIITLKPGNLKSKDKFCEWLRGFADGEGYFLISKNTRKIKQNSTGKIIEYRNVTFSFILHLAAKDVNVLYNIQNQLGGIGKVRIHGNAAVLEIASRGDTDKLLDLMYSSFLNLNTTKVLDFIAWYEARKIYYNFLDKRDKNILLYEDTDFFSILDKVVGIKNSINKYRVDFSLPLHHKVIVTDEWLLGFIEGEGCFYVNGFSVAFKLAQTAVNRNVLEAIKNYLEGKFGHNMVIRLIDSKANRLKAKPYTELYIGKSKNTAYNFISLLSDLSWLSIKALDFINWSIIYILVYEGKHITPQGKDIVAKLKSKSGLLANLYLPYSGDNRGDKELSKSLAPALPLINYADTNLLNGKLISKQVLELLNSQSNYVESDQPGVWKVISNYKGLPSTIHKLNSYVLAINPENGQETSKFKSNAECAKYFEVTKVSVGRWINKNTPVSTKKGVFLFTKAQDDIDT